MLQGNSDLGTADSYTFQKFASSITIPHGVEEVMKTIGHDDVVIDGDNEGENDHGDADPHGAGQHLDPNGKGANLCQICNKCHVKSKQNKI